MIVNRPRRPQALTLVALAVSAVFLGCPTPRTGAPRGTKIAVQEFVIPRDVIVQRYSASYQSLGMEYAEILAQQLKGLGYDAVAVPQGTPLEGDLQITGHIAEIDGGSMAKRVLLGFGAGHSEFDVYGTVSRTDGTVVGEFTESRGGKGWGQEGALKGAMIRTAKLVGRMIYTGEYRRNAPQERPAARASASQAPPAATTIEDRLRVLDRLRADGTISAEEYESKRRAILDSL